MTGDDGKFEMRAPLGPGTRCIMYLEKSDFVLDQKKNHKHQGIHDGRFLSDHETTVDPKKTYALNAIRATVVRARLVTKDGRPVRFQRVLLQESNPNRTPTWMPMAYGQTDREGRFVFRGLHEFDRPVRLHSSGMGGFGSSKPFELDRGQVIGEIKIVVQESASVEGVVVDGNGEPVPGARVWLRDWDFARGRQRSGSVVEVLTDRKGRYRFLGVSPQGHYLQVHVREKNYGQQRDPFHVAPGEKVVQKLEVN